MRVPFAIVTFLFLAPPTFAWQFEEEDLEFAPGLHAVYQADDQKVERIDPDVAFVWGTASADPRLKGSFDHVTWNGRLFVRRGSNYTFWVYAAGRVKLSIADQVLVDGETSEAGWLTSEKSEIPFGFHPLKIEYRPAAKDARISLYWESDQFELEPIGPQDLFRDPELPLEPVVSRGEVLVRSRRCNSCHQIPLASAPIAAPALDRIKNAVHADWLVDYIQAPASKKAHVTMPDFALDKKQAEAVAAYLLSQKNAAPSGKKAKGNAKQGKVLFESIGCLACHQIDSIGKDAPFGGGDLTQIAAKRPAGFFETWLKKPESLNRDHRMPVFTLSSKESGDLAAYLESLGKPSKSSFKPNEQLAKEGKKIIRAKGCAQCHRIDGVAAEASSLKLAFETPGCLGEPDASKNRPGYRMNEADQKAVLAFLRALPNEPATLSDFSTGDRLLDQKGCLNCHSRGEEIGFREVVAQLGVTDPKAQSALVPPSLNSLGDKMQPEWLRDAVAGKAVRLRPWLAPRMPKFKHTEEEIEALAAYFHGHDRIPDTGAEQAETSHSQQEMLLGAHQLVGSAGMGCMSCHTIGSYQPTGVELGARGSDLRFLGKRLRKSWFQRWTRNPARIVPGVEMPSIALANPNILDGKVRTQLDALWLGLNAEQFELPTADAVQVLTATTADRVLILRDPFEHGEGDYTTRPFGIGLRNGHSLLIDLNNFSLRRWWVGDFARQKTRGKTWYWETAGVTLFDNPNSISMIGLNYAGKILQPKSDQQAVAQLLGYEHVGQGVRLHATLNFPEQQPLTVSLTVEPTNNGFTLNIDGYQQQKPSPAPAWEKMVFQQPARERLSLTDSGQLRIESAFGIAQIASDTRITPPGAGGNAYLIAGADTAGRPHMLQLQFSTDVPPPYAAKTQQAFTLAPKSKDLPCMPGYTVTRLPVDDKPMPVALATLADGSLAVASLKGGIFLLKDTDGDGLHDTYSLFSDHLAAPYGLYADGSDIIVSHKPELLRLSDRDQDGFAEESKVIASGWGVTFDYHDWLVGILKDKDGNWYVSPSCQQDDRTPAEAIGRGKVLRISPEGKVDEFAAGIRFAMGLAMNDKGAIFASDNQGVTNTFNELNHIRQGHHYAFWNKLEPRTDDQVTTLAAIQIPHPWTRSVNAIIFIPEDGSFGPFGGQLIGADYTTRKLIRMSLQPVGDTYQGCAYPFSIEDLKLVEQDQTFLGPISLSWGSNGTLYVGSIIDSGWGGGNNRGTVEMVRFDGKVPFGIREIRAFSKGFDIDFTAPVDPRLAADPKQYTLSCYRRIHQGGYATPDQDRTNVQIQKIEVAEDKRSVRLYVEPLRPTFVYDIAIESIHGGKEKPFPEVGYYTLNTVPNDQ